MTIESITPILEALPAIIISLVFLGFVAFDNIRDGEYDDIVALVIIIAGVSAIVSAIYFFTNI